MGPGEYISLFGMGRYGDGLVVWDITNSRATILGPDLSLLDDRPVAPEVAYAYQMRTLEGVVGDHLIIHYAAMGFLGEGRVPPSESRRPETFIFVNIASGVVDRRVVLPGQEEWVQRYGTRGASGGLPVVFGRRAFAAASGSWAILGTNDSLNLRAYDAGLNERSVRFEHRLVEAAPTWRQFVVDSIDAVLASPTGLLTALTEFNRELLRDLPVRATLPAFSDLLGDADGLLWIREYPSPTQSQVTWIALDEDLRPVARFQAPRDLQIVDLSSHGALVSRRGSYGEELVAYYPFVR
jgi:hypothetical protein